MHDPPPVSPPTAALQSRLIARFLAEVQLAVVITLSRAITDFGGRRPSLERIILFVAVMRADTQFGGAATSAVRDHATLTGISVNAVATSLSLPFETMRRHANALIACGLCERTPRGLVIAPQAAHSAVLKKARHRIHDLTVRLIDYLHDHDVALPATRSDVPYQRGTAVSAALDLILAAVEYLDPHYENLTEIYIVNAVMAANARPITFSRDLARRYGAADTVPPMALRLPVTATALAQALHMPYCSVQRQVKRSIARGQLRRVEGGLLVTDAMLDAAGVRIVGPAAAARAARAFAQLVPGGFRFDDPKSCYLDGPPELVDFGCPHRERVIEQKLVRDRR